MSNHSLEDLKLAPTFLSSARDAMNTARITGSFGATARIERRLADGGLQVQSDVKITSIKYVAKDGLSWHLRDEANGWSTSPAFRVLDGDVVLVLSGRPGRYASHIDTDAVLDAAVADEDRLAELEEPVDPDEDWQRSVTHDLDI